MSALPGLSDITCAALAKASSIVAAIIMKPHCLSRWSCPPIDSDPPARPLVVHRPISHPWNRNRRNITAERHPPSCDHA